ncbi:hypothetical protein Ahy_A05g024577 [Arachis hypogaea]|uniref:CCHC-type domain-containing protein n=1 Tax=Arachis hypogaea TaxID=3818 RepID=A0A445D618_ARAHY|nr:hypothetical protein Ahy_A05g024577 [Arachis hypogaea]
MKWMHRQIFYCYGIRSKLYYNGEIIPNTHEGLTFVCECPLSFAIPCTMSFVELQNGLCNNIQSQFSKMVSNILYRNPMLCIYQQTRFHVPMIELYVEFEQQSGLGAVGEEVNIDELGDIDWGEDNSDSEEEFETNYEADDENDDRDLAGNPAVQNEADVIVSQHPFGVPSFMWSLDLEAMYAPKFLEYANMGKGNTTAEDGEFSIRMEFSLRESVISAIKSYTIARGVDYTVYESEPQAFYAKYKGYGEGCDWLIRASLIQKKACWEIRRYNGKHTCTMGTISQDHAKLTSNTIAEAIRLLVEADPSIKVKSIIAEVQSRFNYITLPIWLKAMNVNMPRSHVQIKMLPVYRESEEVQGVDGTHLYGKYKGALMVAVAQDGNQNIVPIAFAIVEGETADVWEFFLTNLRRYVVTIDGVGIISDRHTFIDTVVGRSNGAWSPPRAWRMYCIRHIGSNFLRRFKAPYLHKLSEAYTQWCDDIGVERWMLAFDGGHRWGHMTTNLVECINYVLNGAHNLPVTVIVRFTFYRQNKLFTRKSVEAHECVCNGFTYSEFATKRVKERFRHARNIMVNQFDRRNEMFEVRKMEDGSVYTINLVERLPCRHVLACCANQCLNWQVYVHDVYKMTKICKVYRGGFVPMAKVIANWSLRHATKGRPKSTRYLNEMDSRDMRGPRRCTICGREGHNRSRCPQRAGPSSARGH